MSATWKGVEARLAKEFGTFRTPLSGGNSRHTRSDTLHPKIFFELKHGSSAQMSYNKVCKLYGEVETQAFVENKIPVVVLHDKGSRDLQAFVKLKYFCMIDGLSREVVVQVPVKVLKTLLVTE